MAGGKLSARQRMINLMYLVFIAMMAMNMSKEVLSAFGLMDAKFNESNVVATEKNEALLADLITKGEEKPQEFAMASNKAQQINTISVDFFNYLETLKRDLVKEGGYELDENGKLPFEAMDKTDILDEKWFTGDRLSKPGAAVVERIDKYKKDVIAVLGTDVKYKKAIENFERRFDMTDVVNKDGKKQVWLKYHFQGFPAIASYTKLTAMQNDVKVTENNMFNLFLGNTLTEAVSLKNYKAIVLADKSAFFAGEKFQGKVVLGKYANVTPTKLSVQGQEIDLSTAIDSTGAANLDFNVGSLGDHEIEGNFTFLEDGKPLEIPIIGNYVVVPKPKEASVAADKMNVVYRGLENPLTISIPGVPSSEVNVSAVGIKKIGDGKYMLTPGKGKEVIVNVSANLDDGSKINDKKIFRIKGLPKPEGSIAGVSEGTLNKRDLTTSRVIAGFADFAYDLKAVVTSFSVDVEGKPTINVSGSRLNPEAKQAVSTSKRGATVAIRNIKIRVEGITGVAFKEASPIVIKLKD